MYHTINEFLTDWKFESEATLKILKCLTDEILELKFHVKVRTPGRLALHISLMPFEMLKSTGLIFNTYNLDPGVPSTARKIISIYSQSSAELIEAISSKWTDESLKDEVLMFGESWTIEKILYSLIKHQIHHRGQLTILLRQSGLKIPGVYGPSSEEWMKFGMQPMA